MPVRFNPPPGWSAPAGFDPRRGHLVDPAWPAAPEGWTYWVPDTAVGREPLTGSAPSTALPVAEADRSRGRLTLVIALSAVALAIVATVVYAVLHPSPPPAVGSCWSGSGDWLQEETCTTDSDFIVIQHATTPAGCPMSSTKYLEIDGTILCLVPH